MFYLGLQVEWRSKPPIQDLSIQEYDIYMKSQHKKHFVKYLISTFYFLKTVYFDLFACHHINRAC